MKSHGWKDGIDEAKPTAILLQVRRLEDTTLQKEFLLHGAPNFISKPTKTNVNRFLADIFPFGSNVWYKYSNKPLTNSIKKFVTRFPIATDIGQPRLLLVSVDVKTGTTVTFDSYFQACRRK